MNARTTAVALLLAVLLCSSAAWAQSEETRRSTVSNPFVTGSFTDAVGGQGAFTGNFKLAPFELRGGRVTAVGRLTGTLADSAGNVLARVDQELAWPVDAVDGSCESVRLTFAATDAAVADASVRFDPVELDLAPGPRHTKHVAGLLCSVADLAKREAQAGDLAAKLNDLFRALR